MNDFSEFVSNPGNRFRAVYQPVIGDDGIIELKQIDVVDYRAKIQADAQLCDLNYLLQRYAAGDTTALGVPKGFYGDIVSAPKSLAEAYALNVQAEGFFNQLPLAVREKFDHNFYKFLASAGTPEWTAIFEEYSTVKEGDTTSGQEP